MKKNIKKEIIDTKTNEEEIKKLKEKLENQKSILKKILKKIQNKNSINH